MHRAAQPLDDAGEVRDAEEHLPGDVLIGRSPRVVGRGVVAAQDEAVGGVAAADAVDDEGTGAHQVTVGRAPGPVGDDVARGVGVPAVDQGEVARVQAGFHAHAVDLDQLDRSVGDEARAQERPPGGGERRHQRQGQGPARDPGRTRPSGACHRIPHDSSAERMDAGAASARAADTAPASPARRSQTAGQSNDQSPDSTVRRSEAMSSMSTVPPSHEKLAPPPPL